MVATVACRYFPLANRSHATREYHLALVQVELTGTGKESQSKNRLK